jgi:peptide/nickel transport system permease protein
VNLLSSRVLKQLVQSLVNLFFIITFNFLLFRLLPGDPLKKLFRDPRIPEDTMNEIAKSFGLDQPVWAQYFIYLKNLLQGNLGLSFAFRQPVWDILSERLFNTLLLMLTANFLAILLGVWLGIFAAKHRGKLEDVIGMGTGLVFWSLPTFWIGMLVVVAFTGILPISGMVEAGAEYASTWDYIIDVGKHMILPSVTLALVLMGQYAIIMRNSLSTVMTEDYITTARAKGFHRDAIFRYYAVPNAMLPLVTIIAVNLGLSVAGAIQAEIVFGWPGLGTLVYQSVVNRDYPMLQGAFLIISFAVIFANFLADMIYATLDPRIKMTD